MRFLLAIACTITLFSSTALGQNATKSVKNADGSTTLYYELDPLQAAALRSVGMKPDANGVMQGDGSAPTVTIDNMNEKGLDAFGMVEFGIMAFIGAAILFFIGVFTLNQLGKSRGSIDLSRLAASDPWVRQRLKEMGQE